MAKKRYPEEQIIGPLKQHESGDKTTDILGISQATFHLRKKQYAGLGSRNCGSCGNPAMRMVGSIDSWRICLDRQGLKEIVEKSCEAATAMPAGAVGRGGISIGRSARLVSMPWTTRCSRAGRSRRKHWDGACGRSQRRMCATAIAVSRCCCAASVRTSTPSACTAFMTKRT